MNIEETGLSAEEVQKILLEEVGVAGIAGAAFGAEGKNFLRFSLVSARICSKKRWSAYSACRRTGARQFALGFNSDCPTIGPNWERLEGFVK